MKHLVVALSIFMSAGVQGRAAQPLQCAEFFAYPAKIAAARANIWEYWAPHIEERPELGPPVLELLGRPFELQRNLNLASEFFERPLTGDQIQALMDVHTAGFFMANNVPVPAGYGTYTPLQLLTISKRLRLAFSPAEADALIRSGLSGRNEP